MERLETETWRKPLVQAQNLKKYFKITKKKTLHAVDDAAKIFLRRTVRRLWDSAGICRLFFRIPILH